MQVNVSNTAGQPVSQLEVNDRLFNIPVNTAVMHQAMVCQLNNARQGTRDTKTRGEVAGSTKKLYPQKHTGRARRGSAKSPLLRGGGIVFGPHQRDYHQSLNKKMRSLALRSALSSKVKEDRLIIVDSLDLVSNRTKEMVGVLKNLGINRRALFVTTAMTENLALASRNVQGIKVISLGSLNLVDLLNYEVLVMTAAAVRRAEEIWGGAAPAAPAEVKDKE
ncbi:MAG: 50S ribosomal protein L4 [Chloroflexi bacterium]|nr:50S ribosomal protein L4 [Chloroflexota bacterium]